MKRCAHHFLFLVTSRKQVLLISFEGWSHCEAPDCLGIHCGDQAQLELTVILLCVCPVCLDDQCALTKYIQLFQLSPLGSLMIILGRD